MRGTRHVHYAPLIKDIAKEVMVWSQPALLPILRTMRGIDRLLPLYNGTPDVEYDVDVEVDVESMELPHIFRTTLATIPVESLYLYVAPAVLPRLVWILLDAEVDWRWMDGREDNPWYPTMRLFRQAYPGAWEPVIERVVAALGRECERG